MNHELGTIRCGTTLEMVTVVAALVREGVTFDVVPEVMTGVWIIALTGGY